MYFHKLSLVENGIPLFTLSSSSVCLVIEEYFHMHISAWGHIICKSNCTDFGNEGKKIHLSSYKRAGNRQGGLATARACTQGRKKCVFMYILHSEHFVLWLKIHLKYRTNCLPREKGVCLMSWLDFLSGNKQRNWVWSVWSASHAGWVYFRI